jgi:hypothetical protein
MENKQNYLEQNVSRMIRLASDSTEPDPVFTESLINSALQELGRTDTGPAPLLGINIDRVMKAAAMITIVCGAGFELLLAGLAWGNTYIASAVTITMLANGFAYIGGLIL